MTRLPLVLAGIYQESGGFLVVLAGIYQEYQESGGQCKVLTFSAMTELSVKTKIRHSITEIVNTLTNLHQLFPVRVSHVIVIYLTTVGLAPSPGRFGDGIEN